MFGDASFIAAECTARTCAADSIWGIPTAVSGEDSHAVTDYDWTTLAQPREFKDLLFVHPTVKQHADRLVRWLEERKQHNGPVAMLMVGPPGCGKTTMGRLALQTADGPVMEVNASSQRSGQSLSRTVQARAFTGYGLLLDEIDGACDGADFGMGPLLALMKEMANDPRRVYGPIILAANNPSAPVVRTLKKAAAQRSTRVPLIEVLTFPTAFTQRRAPGVIAPVAALRRQLNRVKQALMEAPPSARVRGELERVERILQDGEKHAMLVRDRPMDLRGSLVAAQFEARRRTSAAPAGVTTRDREESVFDAARTLFMAPLEAKGPAVQAAARKAADCDYMISAIAHASIPRLGVSCEDAAIALGGLSDWDLMERHTLPGTASHLMIERCLHGLPVVGAPGFGDITFARLPNPQALAPELDIARGKFAESRDTFATGRAGLMPVLGGAAAEPGTRELWSARMRLNAGTADARAFAKFAGAAPKLKPVEPPKKVVPRKRPRNPPRVRRRKTVAMPLLRQRKLTFGRGILSSRK